MRLTLSSAAFSSRLATLSRVLNSKNSLPILDCFLFEASNGQLTITASDNENVMKSTIQLDECDSDGRFAINSRTILDAVKELPEQPLTPDVDLNMFSVKVIYQNGMYNFTAQSADDYPAAQSVQEDATRLVMQAGVMNDNITRSLFATANEELRPVMNGLYFDIMTDMVCIVASDGHKLVRTRNMNTGNDTPASFILPKKPAVLLKNILLKDESDVVIRFDSRLAEISFADGSLQCRLIEGKYPNYNSVIPKDNPNKLVLDRKAMLGALRRVLPFASESSQLVRLRIDMGRIEISSEDIDFSTSAKEEMICEYNGMPMSIGFKGTSPVEILNNLGSDEITPELADPSRPCLVIPTEQPEKQDVLMLIMPMLLND